MAGLPDSRQAPIIYARVRDAVGANPKRIEDQVERVISVDYEDTDAKADKLSIDVNNFDLSNFDDPLWAQGNLIEIAWGYPGNVTPTRTCKITSVKGTRTLTVEALDQSIAMHKVTQERTYRGLTRAQIVAQVAEANGYGPELQHIEDTKVTYEHEHQARETDAAFLQRLASREGFVFFVDFDGLHWHRRKLGQRPLREYVYYIDPGRGDVVDFRVENDVTARPAQITMAGRDPLTKSDILATGDNASTERSSLAGILDVFTSSPAPTQGNEASTPEGPIRTVDGVTGETGMRVIVHTTEPTAAGAKRQADGAYRKAVMTVKLSLDAVGDPRQVAKSLITVKGIGKALSGNYYVHGVKHSIKPGSYTMTLSCTRDGRTSLPDAAPAQRADGKLNSQTPGQPGALEPVRVVDGVTGQTVTSYRDTKGRQGGGEGS